MVIIAILVIRPWLEASQSLITQQKQKRSTALQKVPWLSDASVSHITTTVHLKSQTTFCFSHGTDKSLSLLHVFGIWWKTLCADPFSASQVAAKQFQSTWRQLGCPAKKGLNNYLFARSSLFILCKSLKATERNSEPTDISCSIRQHYR